jgi:hypothetical protein
VCELGRLLMLANMCLYGSKPKQNQQRLETLLV